MSWRVVVISGIAKLELRLGYLVVRQETTTRIHLSEIYALMVESTAVSLTAALLSALVQNKVKVIFCDERRNPVSELMPCYGCHDTSLKIGQQVKWDEARKVEVWTAIVANKIKQQQRVLLALGQGEAAGMLEEYIAQLLPGDTTNREGHAAKVYFNAAFGGAFARGKEGPINAALNYGYSVLLSAFNREIVGAGYLTQLGLWHANRFNLFNLSSDLMEPYRPLVDIAALRLNPESFGSAEKRVMANVLNGGIVMDGKNYHVIYAISQYVRSVLNVLNEEAEIAGLKFYEHGKLEMDAFLEPS
ncbi:MAG: type II CRISPR-associated endonuclease Cas1 [Proteobacteria bacterium]|nr:type II CRISPR-associated endonuclease Cas1 [Pseudomonadota bacterium]